MQMQLSASWKYLLSTSGAMTLSVQTPTKQAAAYRQAVSTLPCFTAWLALYWKPLMATEVVKNPLDRIWVGIAARARYRVCRPAAAAGW